MKKEISPSGKNLTILITSERTDRIGDWMVFAAWYSVSKNLPDANIQIICKKNLQANDFQIFFRWVGSVGIKKFESSFPPLEGYKKLLQGGFVKHPILILESPFLMTRNFFKDELEILNCKDEIIGIEEFKENSPFYFHGYKIGPLDLEIYANKYKEPPFNAKWNPESFEEKILIQEWNKISNCYSYANRY